MEVKSFNLALVLIAIIAIAFMFIPIAFSSGTIPNSSPQILMWNIPSALIAFGVAMYFCFKR